MNVLISNLEKKKKKLEKLDNLVKKLVSNCMESNINLQKCKPVLSEPMITTT
jgi:tRNA(Phe) wybutosine-synthesizing methylase Tyw3